MDHEHHHSHPIGNLPQPDKHEGHSISMFKHKFWVSLVLSAAVVLYSDILKELFGFIAPAFLGSNYIPLIFGSAVFFYGGWVFLVGAYRELRAKQMGMMTLIGMAISVAYTYSLYAFFTLGGETLFWELTTLITIMLLGHWVEMRAVQAAKGSLKALAKLLPDTAEVIKGERTETIPLAGLKEGDIILVRPGSKVAADGQVIEGRSEVNEFMISGESKPLAKSAGSEVIAGTINGDGSLKVKVDKIGEKTFLSGVMRLVAEAQSTKSKLQILSDRAAYYLNLIALGSGALTFVLWMLNDSGVNFALQRTVAVLVITCPHALGLAIPLVASISTNLAAKNGLLVKQRMALESARNINIVLFDKTGTLTVGEFGVANILPAGTNTQDEVLVLAASVNSHSEHPIAKAMVKEAQAKNLQTLAIKDFVNVPGKGPRATVGGETVRVGSRTLIQELGVAIGAEVASKVEQLEQQGKTTVFVTKDNSLVGAIALADIIRPESKEAIAALKSKGVKVGMITGDSEEVAKWVARELGIEEYFARVLPHQKSEKVKLLQSKRQKVAMVGDGVNDAPALTQADLGVAIGAGTNVAIESAGIILVKNDPRDIPKILHLSKLTYSKMMQNLFWATGYNVIALPLAAGVLAFKGVLLEPALAAVFMSLSTVIVAFNAALLRRHKI